MSIPAFAPLNPGYEGRKKEKKKNKEAERRQTQ